MPARLRGWLCPDWRLASAQVCGLALGLLAMPGCDELSRQPEIRALMPQQAAAGGSVEILGARFCGQAGAAGETCASDPDGLVSFGAGVVVDAPAAQRWSDGRITVTVPDGASIGDTLLVVEVDGVPSRPVAFSVLP